MINVGRSSIGFINANRKMNMAKKKAAVKNVVEKKVPKATKAKTSTKKKSKAKTSRVSSRGKKVGPGKNAYVVFSGQYTVDSQSGVLYLKIEDFEAKGERGVSLDDFAYDVEYTDQNNVTWESTSYSFETTNDRNKFDMKVELRRLVGRKKTDVTVGDELVVNITTVKSTRA